MQEVLSRNESLGYYFYKKPDWREESILNLPSLLADLNVDVHLDGEDKIVWSLDSRWIFYVKNLYGKMLGSNRPNFPTKAIRKSKALMKVCFLSRFPFSFGKLHMGRF